MPLSGTSKSLLSLCARENRIRHQPLPNRSLSPLPSTQSPTPCTLRSINFHRPSTTTDQTSLRRPKQPSRSTEIIKSHCSRHLSLHSWGRQNQSRRRWTMDCRRQVDHRRHSVFFVGQLSGVGWSGLEWVPVSLDVVLE